MPGLSCGMWIQFPDQGWKPGSLHWELGILATGPPGRCLKMIWGQQTNKNPTNYNSNNKKTLFCSSTLAWKIPWTEEPGGLQSMGSLRVGHDWATSLSIFTFHFPALEKEMATHSSVLAWRIPGTGEPGGLPSMGSHRVGHDWSDLAAAAAAATLSRAPCWPPGPDPDTG